MRSKTVKRNRNMRKRSRHVKRGAGCTGSKCVKTNESPTELTQEQTIEELAKIYEIALHDLKDANKKIKIVHKILSRSNANVIDEEALRAELDAMTGGGPFENNKSVINTWIQKKLEYEEKINLGLAEALKLKKSGNGTRAISQMRQVEINRKHLENIIKYLHNLILTGKKLKPSIPNNKSFIQANITPPVTQSIAINNNNNNNNNNNGKNKTYKTGPPPRLN